MAGVQTVVVTGAGGFLGWHLRCRVHAMRPDLELRLVSRDDLLDERGLAGAMAGADAVVHLASAIRGDGLEVANVDLARRLVNAVRASGGSANVVHANSTHAESESPYGRSKRRAAEVLSDGMAKSSGQLVDLRFPNLFGECARPDHNSAVATFCRDLAAGRASTVHPEGRTELLHVQDACALILDALGRTQSTDRGVPGRSLPIVDVYSLLARLRAEYAGSVVPILADRLELQLFNALRTAMFPAHYPIALAEHRDERGSFVELARGHQQTQVSYSTTAPGVTRGEHFHLDKVERFVVLRGTAEIRVRRLFGDRLHRFAVSGDTPVAVDMPPLHAHDITNIGSDELLTAFWANDHFNPSAPDTYPERLEPAPTGVVR